QIGDPDGRGLPAAVMLPIRLPLKEGRIGDVRPVGRVSAILGHGEGQGRGESTLDRNRKKLVRVGVAETGRAEENRLAIGSPPDSHVRARMKGEAARFTPRGGD